MLQNIINNIDLSKQYFQFTSDFKSLLLLLTPAAIHSEAEYVEFDALLTKLDDELRVGCFLFQQQKFTALQPNYT
ncbi:hypothetical protein [uncultured Draconibacterium sp.]|uniref:hypothetical protein n=1 Tax=uncultured Draconibacterium sp. TaxID=1573823 RepID=UPI0029C9051E|nr:hypothetical protein [uncultured Draconibacterium sp.]